MGKKRKPRRTLADQNRWMVSKGLAPMSRAEFWNLKRGDRRAIQSGIRMVTSSDGQSSFAVLPPTSGT